MPVSPALHLRDNDRPCQPPPSRSPSLPPSASGLGLILSQIGLRGIAPVAGAAISIPTSTVLFLIAAPFGFDFGAWSWPAAAIFAAVGLLYPATGTLLTFAANRRLGPVITGTFGNLAPIFAVTIAFLFLGEPLRPGQIAGLALIIAGVMVLTRPHGGPLPTGAPGSCCCRWRRRQSAGWRSRPSSTG